jgi:polysaccharide export outer membrane protein
VKIKTLAGKFQANNRRAVGWLGGFMLALAAFGVTGCHTEDELFTPPPSVKAMAESAPTNEVVTLREGDVLKISFPGSPSLNTVQTIRKDGIISLPLVGEVLAAGMTPDELDKKLMDLFAPQITTKEVSVEVQSSAFPIYLTGAVLRPGKILSDHRMTALEAVMEAGGFDYTKANLKAVVVIRKEAGGTKNYIVNLKDVIDGKTGEPFYLKPDDIVFVQEKFNWF